MTNKSKIEMWDPFVHGSFWPERLEIPFHWKKPRRIFVCSMSDLFHESLTNEQIAAVFGVMAATPHHQYVALTKRLRRAVEWFEWSNKCDEPEVICGREAMKWLHRIGYDYGCGSCFESDKWPLPNVIICASIEDQHTADERVPLLLQIPAAKRGVSVEPMLGPVDLELYLGEDRRVDCGGCTSTPVRGQPVCHGHDAGGIDWIVCGAETGPGKRPFRDEWALDLRDQCKAAGTLFFFKKDGSGKPTL